MCWEVAKLDVKGNEAVNIADQLLPAEMGSSMEQLGYNSEHLVCVQQVESTSEAKSVGQVTNLPELSKSKVSVQKFVSPIMSAESSQQIVSSSSAKLKDVTPISASKVTHALAVGEATVSEKASNLNVKKLRKQKHSRSVHFSPSRVASAEQIIALESTTAVPRMELACESASTILPKKTALKVGDQLIPEVRGKEMNKEKQKSERALTTLNIDLSNSVFGTEQVANVPSITQCQVPVLIEKVAESSKIILSFGDVLFQSCTESNCTKSSPCPARGRGICQRDYNSFRAQRSQIANYRLDQFTILQREWRVW